MQVIKELIKNKSQNCENQKFAQKCPNDPKNHSDTFEQGFDFHTFDFCTFNNRALKCTVNVMQHF